MENDNAAMAGFAIFSALRSLSSGGFGLHLWMFKYVAMGEGNPIKAGRCFNLDDAPDFNQVLVS